MESDAGRAVGVGGLVKAARARRLHGDSAPVWHESGKLWYRPGTGDEYVINERPYRSLLLQPGDVVLDVGAHIGTFSLRAVRAGAVTVFAYEPDPSNYALLCRNLAEERRCIGEDTGVLMVASQSAVVADAPGADGGSVTLYHTPHSMTGNHTIVPTRGRVPLEVPTVSWSRALECEPTIVKVDVEGAELWYDWDLLPGSVRAVAAEFHLKYGSRSFAEERIGAIARRLIDIGFTAVREPKPYTGWSTTEGVFAR